MLFAVYGGLFFPEGVLHAGAPRHSGVGCHFFRSSAFADTVFGRLPVPEHHLCDLAALCVQIHVVQRVPGGDG